MSTRHPTTFESANAQQVATFPRQLLEWQPTQNYRVANVEFVGADYGVDLIGGAPAPKAIAQENIRCTFVGSSPADADSLFDIFVATARSIGLGKLWVTDDVGVRYWAYAKLASRPAKVSSWQTPTWLPTTTVWWRYSDWQDATATTGTVSITVTPTTFTISVPGNTSARALVLTLRSLAGIGWHHPSLTNNTLAQTLSTTRDAAGINSRLQIDPDRFRVVYSNDGGSTYANDYNLVTLGTTQVALFELGPGDNSLTYIDSGVPNMAIDWSFNPTHE